MSSTPNRGVCLDGRSLHLERGTGVATYARTLATGLGTIARPAQVLLNGHVNGGRLARRVRAAWPGQCRAVPGDPPPGFDAAWRAPDVFRLAQVHFDIHRRLLRVRAEHPPAIMHWTYPVPMAWTGTANIYTIHDLIPLSHPALTGIDPARFARIVRGVVRHADHIVTVSEASRRDIIDRLGVPAERVTNTYQSLDLPSSPAGRPARTGHFLFCGAIEPRKNLRRLVAAYGASGASAPLILAGPDGWRADAELEGVSIRPLAAAPDGALPGGVWRAPYLPRAELMQLMRGARALLFPSLAEGFGLPIAEAMALGTPVLTSRGGATGEVAGDAGLLIDPLDGAGMAGAIAALDRDAGLCERLAAAGLRRAPMFSTAACLGRLAPVYDRAGATRP